MFPFLVDLGTTRLPGLGEVRLALPTYGLALALGIVVAWLWLRALARRDGLDPERVSGAAFFGLLCGVAGGKLGLLVVEAPYYLAHPRDLFSAGFVQAAGVIWAAVLGGLAGFVFGARRYGVPVLPVLDAAAVAVPLAQAVGRLGCLAAGCCYGAPAPAALGVVYRSAEANDRTGVPLGVPLHAFPLYEAALDGLLLVPLLYALWRRRGRAPGEVVAAYLVLYGAGRFVLEFARGDAIRGVWFGGTLSTSQLVSAAVVPLAAAGFVFLRRRAAGAPPAGDAPAADGPAASAAGGPVAGGPAASAADDPARDDPAAAPRGAGA